MSSGTSLHPAYHLRPNKAIDRFMLIDVLRNIPLEKRKKYEYIGLGGPFLEDFKIMHHYYPEISLTSIEENEDTFKRQKFNKSFRAINLVKSDIASYFSEHDEFGHPLVVWFDGTDFRQRTIENIITILNKLPIGSILKVTARVSFETEPRYKEFASEVVQALNEYLKGTQLSDEEQERLALAIRNISDKVVISKDEMWLTMQTILDYLPEGYENMLEDQISRAKLYHQILRKAISSVYPNTGDNIFYLLSSNYYSDGTTMISVTGMLVRRKDLSKVRKMFKSYQPQGDQLVTPTKIDVPVLSIKERMELDALLPMRKNVGSRLYKALGYKIDSSRARTEAQLTFYNVFHKYYPFFSKIQL